MTKTKTMLGLAAACAACCAVPFVPIIVTALTGFGLAGIGAALSGWWLAIAGTALVALAAAVLFYRRRAATRCAGPVADANG